MNALPRLLSTALLTAALAACTQPGDSPFMPLDNGSDGVADVPADAPEPTGVSWKDEILPLFGNEEGGYGCTTCHGDGQMQGGLNVTTVAGLHDGGFSGPAVVACEPGEGTLLDKLGPNPSFGLRMPTNNPEFLSGSEIALIETWIAQGAEETYDPEACQDAPVAEPEADVVEPTPDVPMEVSPDVPMEVAPDVPEEVDAGPTLVTWVGEIEALLEEKSCSHVFCHGNAASGDLRITSVEDLEVGGEHGPAVVPCEPGEGTLLDKVRPNPSFGERMPVDREPLSADEIALVETWIAQGALVDADDPVACE